MDIVLSYRGKSVNQEDVASIRELIAKNQTASRRKISLELCERWQWRQPNGAPRDMVCRGLLLALHRQGHIALPEARYVKTEAWFRRRPADVEVSQEPIATSLAELSEIEITQVRRTKNEALVNALIEKHHYLGYSAPVGEHLKYLVTAAGRPIGCFVWSSAPLRLTLRDDFIGWPVATRERTLNLVAYQSRFLILPWVRVPHLASHLLGRMSRQLSADWQRVYAHPIYLAQTFVDPTLYKGTCYKAANWTYLGLTAGRGNHAPTMRQTRSNKQLYVYPLVKDFRLRLSR